MWRHPEVSWIYWCLELREENQAGVVDWEGIPMKSVTEVMCVRGGV